MAKMKKIILVYKICQQHLALMGDWGIRKETKKKNRQSINVSFPVIKMLNRQLSRVGSSRLSRKFYHQRGK
jgi:hypothetical protein